MSTQWWIRMKYSNIIFLIWICWIQVDCLILNIGDYNCPLKYCDKLDWISAKLWAFRLKVIDNLINYYLFVCVWWKMFYNYQVRPPISHSWYGRIFIVFVLISFMKQIWYENVDTVLLSFILHSQKSQDWNNNLANGQVWKAYMYIHSIVEMIFLFLLHPHKDIIDTTLF